MEFLLPQAMRLISLRPDQSLESAQPRSPCSSPASTMPGMPPRTTFSSRGAARVLTNMTDATPTAQPSGLMLRVLALACLLVFLATGFRRGFQRDETDFPNYYTAAVLVRTHAPLRKFYEWTWFAREMDRVGIGTRVGSYTP